MVIEAVFQSLTDDESVHPLAMVTVHIVMDVASFLERPVCSIPVLLYHSAHQVLNPVQSLHSVQRKMNVSELVITMEQIGARPALNKIFQINVQSFLDLHVGTVALPFMKSQQDVRYCTKMLQKSLNVSKPKFSRSLKGVEHVSAHCSTTGNPIGLNVGLV